MSKIKEAFLRKPLLYIIWIALFLRLIAAIFSQGYIIHSDHFSVVEAAQSWVIGEDYNNWLPWNQETPEPHGNSLFYVGLNYIIFLILHKASIVDPQIKMIFIRILHALLSLLIVHYSYKITYRLSNKRYAIIVGFLMAAAWFMPFLSVRNLDDMVCIPFVLVGIYRLLKAEEQPGNLVQYLIGGFLMAIAFSIKFQILVFLIAVGFVLLFQKKILQALIFGVGVLLSITALQGVVDFFIWDQPFAELIVYLRNNWIRQINFGTDIWYINIILICAVFFIPVGIYFLVGFFRVWKKHLIIFLPSFLYLIFISLFKTKELSLVITIIPFFIILGVLGWYEFAEKSKFIVKYSKIHTITWIVFCFFNLALLPLFTLFYTKKARVDAMLFLSKNKDEIHSILLEDSNRDEISFMPDFYIGKQVIQYHLPRSENHDISAFGSYEAPSKNIRRIYSAQFFKTVKPEQIPEYVLFFDIQNLDERVVKMKEVFPYLSYETKTEPIWLDRLLHRIDNQNRNLPIFIFKTKID